jgi:hypothetical protein
VYGAVEEGDLHTAEFASEYAETEVKLESLNSTSSFRSSEGKSSRKNVKDIRGVKCNLFIVDGVGWVVFGFRANFGRRWDSYAVYASGSKLYKN